MGVIRDIRSDPYAILRVRSDHSARRNGARSAFGFPALFPYRGHMGSIDRMNEDEWRVKLSPQQFAVLREGATEAPFTGEYDNNKASGTYLCAGCGETLFVFDDKFDSGSGWPSFSRATNGMVNEKSDTSHGMTRTEILCNNCGGHLGHVFPDGPGPNGLRYCVNSASLDFEAN